MIRLITGNASGVLAHNKFAVYAFLCSLLVPRAGNRFRSALRLERYRRKHAVRLGREIANKRTGERRLQQLLESVEKHLFFRFQPQTVRSITSKPLPPPHWTGEARPSSDTVPLPSSQFPDGSYLLMLVRNYGYDADAAVSALSRSHVWRDPRPDRRRNGLPVATLTPLHPFRSAVPSRRTTQGGGFSRVQVLASISAMRTDEKTRKAVFEVVYRRQPPKGVIAWDKM